MGKPLKMIEGILATDSFWSQKIPDIMRKIEGILRYFYKSCGVFGRIRNVNIKITKMPNLAN